MRTEARWNIGLYLPDRMELEGVRVCDKARWNRTLHSHVADQSTLPGTAAAAADRPLRVRF